MRTTRAFLAAVLASALTGALACARPAEERHLDAMREEIDAIQSDRDREARAEPEPAAADQAAPMASGPRRPAATQGAPNQGSRTIGSGDDAAEDNGPDTDDPAPRPTIRVLGAARAMGRGLRGDDQVEQNFPSDGSASSALDPEAKRAYDAALSLVNARQYDRALDALAAFLVKWPDHPYADNAMYWRGECYFAQGNYARASEQFEGVVSRFPAGNKAPDALLKLGICQQKLGSPTRAKEVFTRLAAQYPQSEAARHIPAVTVPAVTPPGPTSEDRR
jgi:tol-pal system protein YbgF